MGDDYETIHRRWARLHRLRPGLREFSTIHINRYVLKPNTKSIWQFLLPFQTIRVRKKILTQKLDTGQAENQSCYILEL
jgi:hypothetical protein